MWFSIFIIIMLLSLVAARLLLNNNNWTIAKNTTYIFALIMALISFFIYASVGDLPGVIKRNFFNSHKGEIVSAFKVWQEHPVEVAHVLEARLVKNPDDMTARRLLANLYLRQRQYKQAKIILQPAFDADKADITISLLMAEILQHQNKVDKSICIINRIINNKNTTAGGLWVAGNLASKAHNNQVALKAFRLARAILVAQGKDVTNLDQAISNLI